MKQTNKLKMIAAMAISILSFTITSCSNDDFFGLDIDNDNYDSGYNDVFDLNDSFEYLEMSDYNAGQNINDSDFSILCKAEERLTVVMTKNGYKIKQKNGKAVNISQQLYNYIEDNYEHLNYLMGYSKMTKAFKRKKTGNREGEGSLTESDCVGYSIAYALEKDFSFVDSELKGRFADYRAGLGLDPDSLEAAMKMFNTNALSRNTLHPFAGFDDNTNEISLHGGVFGNNGHAVTAVKVKKNPSGLWYNVWYHDYQSGGIDHYYMIWPDDECNIVPTVDKMGNTVISVYVY